MKINRFPHLPIITLIVLVVSFISCEKDAADLGSDIINPDVATNFDILKDSFDIISYTRPLGPVQTNNLNLNMLGLYDDVYGRTSASFVTQVGLDNFNPDFGDNTVLDSVVLTIPYFSSIVDVDEETDEFIYRLDSVFGGNDINLRIFENNYFLRDFDPNEGFDDIQQYFSNKSASVSEPISDAILEGEELVFVEYDENGEPTPIDNRIEISSDIIVLTRIDENEDTLVTRITPAIRLKLDPTFWQNKIINQEGQGVLSNVNNFNDYFRGLYFRAEAINDEGSFLILNLGSTSANITLHYTQDNPSTEEDAPETIQSSLIVRLGQNRVNFIENNFSIQPPEGDETNGDSRIYLKGGEGSLAQIKLFNGEDLDDNNDDFNAFEQWKNDFVETDSDGKFVKSKRLVNEANLVFYVDRDVLDQNMLDPEKEPNRIYLYDIENKTPLVDYFLDGVSNSIPSASIVNHLGPLQRVDDEPDGKGIKYKLKITDHINNLLIRDSTNVDLGLSVSLNVNLEEIAGQRNIQSDDSDLECPLSSIITPRGTILHGNNTEDQSKRVYLEIYYTEPNN